METNELMPIYLGGSEVTSHVSIFKGELSILPGAARERKKREFVINLTNVILDGFLKPTKIQVVYPTNVGEFNAEDGKSYNILRNVSSQKNSNQNLDTISSSKFSVWVDLSVGPNFPEIKFALFQEIEGKWNYVPFSLSKESFTKSDVE